MDAFVSRKRRKIMTNETASQAPIPSTASASAQSPQAPPQPVPDLDPAPDQTTDEKLAILSSVFEQTPHDTLLETLIANNGSLEASINSLLTSPPSPPSSSKPRPSTQSALSFATTATPLTRKGKTLYLFDPAAIAKHTPCTIIHNFLPPNLATDLLRELLPETQSFTSASFRLFDKPVQSPHTACFYVNSLAEAESQKSYLYNGSTLSDVREILPVMRRVSRLVEQAVNDEIAKRIETYPGRTKLRYQPMGPWTPNAAFVNCYDGPDQSVGYHTDQLTYLGPHPVIGSLSLGVQREFRIRRIVPPPDLTGLDPNGGEAKRLRDEYADAQGQIALPLPHNSLLVMHAEMQERWKHSISVAGKKDGGITPHPVAGRKRLNITYRWYRDEFRPEFIPNCKCGAPTVLKSVMKREATRGKYVWMCQTAGRVDDSEGEGKGCGYFEWAEFDDDGVPIKDKTEATLSELEGT